MPHTASRSIRSATDLPATAQPVCEFTPPLKAVRVPAISQLHRMLDHLETRLEPRVRQQDGGSGSGSDLTSLQEDLDQLLKAVQELVAGVVDRADEGNAETDAVSAPEPPVRARRSAIRIQLKLSPDLVRVLQTVREAHVRASDLVESVLWESPRVRDTARLVGIPRPPRKRTA